MAVRQIFLLIALYFSFGDCRYQPNWDSIDSRPLPPWFDEAKFGIFLHWGVFSVPSFYSEWFWNAWVNKNPSVVAFMEKNYKPNFTYAEFAPMFTAEFFDPNVWADIFQASGAKYVVLTSKHHEGYTMWPSKYSWNWNVKDVGPNRDLLGDLASAVRSRTDLVFGLYHSLFEWYHPLYLRDKANHFNTSDFVKAKTMPELRELVMKYRPAVVWSDGDWEAADKYWTSTDFLAWLYNDRPSISLLDTRGKTMPELYEIVTKYKPAIVWSDGDAGPDTYWTSQNFLAWLYNDSPVKDIVVTNDRWGTGTSCKHGGYYTCSDKYNPGVLQKHKWENCMTIDRDSWGYRRDAKISDFLPTEELIQTLAETVSCGGNLLMNVGPTPDGRIAPVFEERLRQMGSWLEVNGEAIYGSRPWIYQNDTVTKGVWYTSKVKPTLAVYAIVLNWPKANILHLAAVNPPPRLTVTMLGYGTTLKWQKANTGVEIIFPAFNPNEMPSQWAWVLKFSQENSILTDS